jgi:CRISPR-associated protein Csm1
MDKKRNEIYLAALLHDIGKFYQRADQPFAKSKELKPHIKNLSYLTNTTQDGYPTHQHAYWTMQFLENKDQIISKLNLQTDQESICNLASYHHRPTNENQAFIQLADWWSSGMDRSVFDEKNLVAHNKQEKYKKVPMISVFGSLIINGAKSPNRSYQVQPLSIVDSFPQEYSNEHLNDQALYQSLWKKFDEEFDLLPTTTIEAFSVSLYYLLKKYLWFIPASTIDFPDSSLFQHSKLTAAFAQCFYDYQLEQKGKAFSFNSTKGRFRITDGIFPVVLLGVDLSGIQAFLYNTSSKFAAKSLRGRSFYLQMIIESICWKLIRETRTTPSHIVYNSGGKFFMLLPNTDYIHQTLRNFFIQVDRELWKKHEGALSVSSRAIPFYFDNNIERGNPNISIQDVTKPVYLGDLWGKLISELNTQKTKQYRTVFLENFQSLFVNTEDLGGNVKVCAVTGREVIDQEISEVKSKLKDEEDLDMDVSLEVFEQKELGECLLGHTHIAFSDDFPDASRNIFTIPGAFKFSVRERDSIPFNSIALKTIYSDQDIDFLEEHQKAALGFRFFGGAEAPVQENNKKRVKTFEELTGIYIHDGKRFKDNNFPRLGVLRMDVDNLGRIFINGFDIKQQSFSAFATLSGMLDLFFSGYLNTLRNTEEFKKHIMIIYSGGDDIFAVGRWNKIITFGFEIQKKFREFTGRDDLSISGGIELFDPKFPISKAAESSGEAESRAKSYRKNSKNALCLFGIPIQWGNEWEKVTEWKELFYSWLKDDIISRGLLTQLFNYYQIFEHDKKEAQESRKRGTHHQTDLSWKWNAAYNLARRSKTVEKSPEKKQALDRLKTFIFTELNETNFRFEAFAVAMRWAELLFRMDKQDHNIKT